MKKFILSLILIVLFIPFYVVAETCDTDKLSISSITVEEKSSNVEEIDEASANGKNINLNLSMSDVGDSIKYKVIVKNDSNEDYELNKSSFNIKSDYIDYFLDSADDSNIVKANTSKIVYLKIQYKNEVPDELFESGAYNDNKSITVQLSNDNNANDQNTIKNPKTGVQSYILLILLLLLSICLYVLLKKKEYTKYMVILLIISIFIPLSVYAICKCEINIKSKIRISNNPKFCYTYLDENYYFEFINGMTWSEYIDSEFNKGYIQYSSHRTAQPVGYEGLDYCNTLSKINGVDYGAYEDDLIISSDTGCYSFSLGYCK